MAGLYGMSPTMQGFVVGFVPTIAQSFAGIAKLLSGIDKPYLIVVHSRELAKNDPASYGMVVAKLQEEFSLSVDSKWYSFLEGLTETAVGRLANVLTQTIGYSVQTAISSRRMWMSTSPVRIHLKMQFMAETNAETEVMRQVRNLQYMAMPSLGAGGMLIPPGPSPFANLQDVPLVGGWLNTARQKLRDWGASYGINVDGDRISIDIGTALRFENVIVKSVGVKFDTRMSAGATWLDASGRGKPIAATADVEFETYQILTKESLGKVYDTASSMPMAGPLDKIIDMAGNLPNL